jgi:thioredoxin:protein disulfide reductase
MMGRCARVCRCAPVRRTNFCVLAIAVVALCFETLFALPTGTGAQPLPNPSEVVKIEGLRLARPLRAGGASKLIVDAEILDGWHINSDHPNSSDFIPTQLVVKPPAGLKAGAVKYPPAEQIAPAFSGGEKLSVFTGPIKFAVALSAAADFKPSGAEIAVTLKYQPCNDNICLPPAKVSASAPLSTLESSAAGASSPRASAASSIRPAAWYGATNVATPVSGTAEVSYPAGAGGRVWLADFDTPAGLSGEATRSGSKSGGWNLSHIFAQHGMLVGLLIVLLGGLALNLTPCVYPLIGVTLAYFANQGGGPRKIAILAITYVLGIALTFSGLGVAVALSGGLFGTALQNPWVLAVIAAMLLVLAGSSFGLFSLQPPQWLMKRAGVARPGYFGALAMGLGMGVVAAPCIGPIVLGLLLMVERSADPLFGFALFFTLAVGLGLPYIALALAAGHIRRLPRSGEWLAWVEQFFGFVLVGLALYFLDPLVHGWMTLVMPYYLIGAGIFLGFVTPAGRRWRPFLVFRSAVGAASVGALAYLMLFPAPKPTPQLSFDPYNARAVAQARADNKPVVIDFSASWCIPCREMQHTTFRDPAVIQAASYFVRLRADLTETDERNKRLTDMFDIRGVPTTVFIDKRGRILKREVGYVGAQQFLSDLREIQEIDANSTVNHPAALGNARTVAATSL